MKKLSVLKLNQLGKAELFEREMNRLRGGIEFNCGCGCHYEDSQGASTMVNRNANSEKGLISYGGSKTCWKAEGYDMPFVEVAAFN